MTYDNNSIHPGQVVWDGNQLILIIGFNKDRYSNTWANGYDFRLGMEVKMELYLLVSGLNLNSISFVDLDIEQGKEPQPPIYFPLATLQETTQARLFYTSNNHLYYYNVHTNTLINITRHSDANPPTDPAQLTHITKSFTHIVHLSNIQITTPSPSKSTFSLNLY